MIANPVRPAVLIVTRVLITWAQVNWWLAWVPSGKTLMRVRLHPLDLSHELLLVLMVHDDRPSLGTCTMDRTPGREFYGSSTSEKEKMDVNGNSDWKNSWRKLAPSSCPPLACPRTPQQ